MAVKISKTPVTPGSTDTVKIDGEPITTHAETSNVSTGAVDYVSPGTTSVDHLGAAVVVNTKPVGPVTTRVSWLAESKVVTPETPEDDPKVETK